MHPGFDDISSIATDMSVLPNSDMRDIERRLMILEEENKQLRDLGFYKSEVERLKLELDYADSLKHKYRNMYNDAAVQLMYLQNTDSLIFEENDQIVNLNKKIEMLVSANEDLKRQNDLARQELLEEQDQNSRLAETVIPQLERQIAEMTGRQRARPHRSLCVERGEMTRIEGGPRKQPILKSSPAKRQTEEVGRKNSSVGKNAKGFYMPSFMRGKVSSRTEVRQAVQKKKD